MRVTLVLTTIHHLIINGDPATTGPPAFCVEKVAVKRATCASNDPGDEIKKPKCVYTAIDSHHPVSQEDESMKIYTLNLDQ